MPKRAEVERWFRGYDNPMKPVVLAIRDAVLAADPRIDECIKWQAPTFTFAGNLASFFPKSKQHASLMFHEGAKLPGKHPRLEGTGDTSRVLKLASVAEVAAAKDDIKAIVAAWIQLKTSAAPKRAKAATKGGSGGKKPTATKGAAGNAAARAAVRAPTSTPRARDATKPITTKRATKSRATNQRATKKRSTVKG